MIHRIPALPGGGFDLGAGAGNQAEVRAFAGKSDGDGPADAPATPGDHGDLASKLSLGFLIEHLSTS
jgi:hypothetical protein